MNAIVSKKRKKFNLMAAVCGSVSCHLALAGVIIYGSLYASEVAVNEGDNAIKAVMIDLSQIAAPELSLVEDSQESSQEEHKEEIKEPEKEVIEQEPEPEPVQEVEQPEPIVEPEPEPLPEPDSVIETEVVKPEIQQPKPTPPKPPKPPKPKPPAPKPSKPQVRQEVNAPNMAQQAVAPSISESTQYAAVPSPVSRRQPEYPRRALDLRIEGRVVVRYDIDGQGRVTNIRIIDAKPSNIFNQSVRSAMRLWKYEPRAAKDLTITIIFNRDKSISLNNS